MTSRGEAQKDLPAGPDDAETVTGTWTATAKGHHEQYSGELQIEVGEMIDLAEPQRTHLRLQQSDWKAGVFGAEP